MMPVTLTNKEGRGMTPGLSIRGRRNLLTGTRRRTNSQENSGRIKSMASTYRLSEISGIREHFRRGFLVWSGLIIGCKATFLVCQNPLTLYSGKGEASKIVGL